MLRTLLAGGLITMRSIVRMAILIIATAAVTSGAAFTFVPATTCANNGFRDTLVVGGGGGVINVTGAIAVNILPGAMPCMIQWEVEDPFIGPAGMWTNTSRFAGAASVAAGE